MGLWKNISRRAETTQSSSECTLYLGTGGILYIYAFKCVLIRYIIDFLIDNSFDAGIYIILWIMWLYYIIIHHLPTLTFNKIQLIH